MIDRNIEIDLSAVQHTLLLPLLARARDAEKSNSVLFDLCARDVVARLNYDFSALEKGEHAEGEQLSWAIRAWNFDNTVKDFLKQKGDVVAVNIGAGLDTTFQRVDDGNVRWLNIDLPDVVGLRRTLVPDSVREVSIAKSVFDFSWFDDIAEHTAGRRVLLMAAGVLFYFDADEVRDLFRRLADKYPSVHFVFDAMSSAFWIALTNWQMHRTGKIDKSVRLKWHLRKASQLRRWVSTVKVVEEYSMFSRIAPRDDWDKKVIRDMKFADFLRMYKMIHVKL